MTFKERFFHASLFELGALLVAIGFVKLVSTETSTHTAFGLSVAIAITAMVLNFSFNYCFDKVFTGRREARGWWLRLFHTTAFETTLLIFTVPMVAFAMDLGWWQALLADISLTLVVMVYALIFNWVYDHARLKFVEK